MAVQGLYDPVPGSDAARYSWRLYKTDFIAGFGDEGYYAAPAPADDDAGAVGDGDSVDSTEEECLPAHAEEPTFWQCDGCGVTIREVRYRCIPCDHGEMDIDYCVHCAGSETRAPGCAVDHALHLLPIRLPVVVIDGRAMKGWKCAFAELKRAFWAGLGRSRAARVISFRTLQRALSGSVSPAGIRVVWHHMDACRASDHLGRDATVEYMTARAEAFARMDAAQFRGHGRPVYARNHRTVTRSYVDTSSDDDGASVASAASRGTVDSDSEAEAGAGGDGAGSVEAGAGGDGAGSVEAGAGGDGAGSGAGTGSGAGGEVAVHPLVSLGSGGGGGGGGGAGAGSAGDGEGSAPPKSRWRRGGGGKPSHVVWYETVAADLAEDVVDAQDGDAATLLQVLLEELRDHGPGGHREDDVVELTIVDGEWEPPASSSDPDHVERSPDSSVRDIDLELAARFCLPKTKSA